MKKRFGWLISFFKIGAIGFGGGTSLIPVIEHEMVEKRKQVTKEEYDSAVIAASITPGALPVEISAYIGKDVGGIKGMLLAPACMILPGVLLTVIMLATMDSVDAEVIKQIEILSIGITAFIFSMMTKYINGTFRWAGENNCKGAALAVVLCVFFLSCGKSAGKILTSFGLDWDAILSISTVHILAMAFFVICYAGSLRTKISYVVTVAGCILYVLFQSKAQFMLQILDDGDLCLVLFRVLQIVMLILSVYGVSTTRDRYERIEKVSPKGFIKECAVWFVILIIACIPAYFMVPELVKYIGNGFISSLISFGGGDAYLTVADGMFVEKGMVSEEEFYGRLVILVNVLPGSILCKTLTGVGYYYGYNAAGMTAALLTAFAGFVCSLIGSCFTMSIARYFFDTFENLKAFCVLKSWTKAIISGLLGTVILSLLYQCIEMAQSYHIGGATVLAELLIIYGLNIFLERKYKLGTWVNVLISIGTALVLGNIFI